jgi:uncharacterized protein (DUF2141 family)
MKFAILILINISIISFREVESDNWQNINKEGIELLISNIRNKNGLLRIGVFSSAKGYPDYPSVFFSLSKDTISSGQLRLFIPVNFRESYSITILDDENNNGRIDYIFGIKPREGFGFSNNPKVTSRKPPPFEQTQFLFSGGKKKVSVRMVYI